MKEMEKKVVLWKLFLPVFTVVRILQLHDFCNFHVLESWFYSRSEIDMYIVQGIAILLNNKAKHKIHIGRKIK